MTISNETQLHVACFIWFWNTFPSHRRMLLHVDNNSFNAIEGNKKRAMGVVKGVSDFILILESETIFIELKFGSGKQSAEQIDFMNKVIARGHQYVILRTLDEFKSFINARVHKIHN